MDRDHMTIRPGVGLGDLKFGASRDEVQAYLGEPVVDDENLRDWLNWEYPEIGVSVSFDREYSLRLLSISTTSKESSLFGHRLIGMKSKEALEIIEGKGLGGWKRVKDALGWEAEFNDVSVEFRFDDDQLWLISWRALIDEHDKVNWPE